MSAPQPWIFGEVLFDCFPDGGRVLGGAPFNVAWHLQALGQDPLLISRVGQDSDGAAIRLAMQDWQMDTAALQSDPGLPTGQVTIEFQEGEPAYDIVHPAAWDAIESRTPPGAPSLLYHGSLALRGEASRTALWGLLDTSPRIVFVDVNLRAPWWSREHVLSSLVPGSWVKLNSEEFDLLHGADPAVSPKAFLQRHALGGLILTRGSKGADIVTSGGEALSVRPPWVSGVTDTVGAGDALAAVLICGLLEGWPLRVALDRAQEFASGICGRQGATVQDRQFYRAYAERWMLGRNT